MNRIPPPISRQLHKQLVGALSALAAAGTVGQMRRATKHRPTIRRFPRRFAEPASFDEASLAADDAVSNLNELPPGI